MTYYSTPPSSDELYHYGIKGMRWGVRRWQNEDGSLTPRGKQKYGTVENYEKKRKRKRIALAAAAAAIGAGGFLAGKKYVDIKKHKEKMTRIRDDIYLKRQFGGDSRKKWSDSDNLARERVKKEKAANQKRLYNKYKWYVDANRRSTQKMNDDWRRRNSKH